MIEPDDEPEPVTVEITADTGPFTEALHRAQAALLFNWHPELAELDDSLDNIFGDGFEN